MKTLSLFAAVALVCASRLAADVVAPSVPSASISPSSVNVSSGNGSITATLRITDSESGVHFGNLFLYNSTGDFIDAVYFDSAQRTSGTALDGIYTITMAVPQYAAPGTWRVDALVEDMDLNRRNIGPGNPDTFPIPAAMTFTLANSGAVDSAPPGLFSALISPESADVTDGGATVTITVNCGDSPSGLDYGFIYPNNPNGDLQSGLITYFSDSQRTSGNAANGIYQIQITLPQGSDAGDWTFDVYLKDRVGNSSFPSAGGVTVTSGPQPAPLATRNFLAQAVDAIGLSWSTGGSGWVMQSIDSHDDLDAAMSLPTPDNGQSTFQTTVTGPGTLSFQWRVDSEEGADFLSVSIDGNVINGISGYTDWALFSTNLTAGSHTVVWRYAKNGSSADGDDRGWVDEVRFQRSTDQSLPQLQDLRMSSRSVNLNGGPQNVTFQIDVTDDANGLSGGIIQLFDPSGNPRSSTTFNGSSRIQGDSLAGTYEVSLPVSNTAGFGMWRAEITLTEAGSNATRHYGPTGEAFPISSIESFHAGNPSASDTTKPLVRALEVTPGAVNVSTGPATATVTLQVTDTIAGFDFGNVSVYNPLDGWTGSYDFDGSKRISGDAFNGIYQLQIIVPQHGRPGTWSVGCYAIDTAGNDLEYPYDLNFPSDVLENFTVTDTGTIDLNDPVVTSMDVTPSQIVTTNGSAQIQVTVSIQDDVSGLLQAFAYFYNPSNVFQGSLSTMLDGTNRTSGNDISGTYQFSKTLPQGSALGQWQVRIFVRDKTGGTNSYGQGGDDYPEVNDRFFTITVPSVSLYSAFTTAYSLSGNNALPGADPDQDGRNNATELMLGTNPNSAASSGAGLITVSRNATHLRLDFTINPALTVTTNGGFLELRDGSGGPPLKVTGQTQAALAGTWTNTTPVLVSGSIYRVSLALASGSKGFARLRFETP
ncbi:MAG: hypothetical protein ABIS50_16760 [Luteolibacter sp.]|uniref:DUF7035 domain-containing protein n=1 Tax=Luteolibacter sp. TaxID=1962973 RepID=UPI003266C22C